MRCYFIKGGHIVDVELLDGLTDSEAREKARSLFDCRLGVEGYEVWDRARIVTKCCAAREGSPVLMGAGMVYDIEFIRQLDAKAEALASTIRLVTDEITAAIQQADQLYRRLDMVPPPDGFRIRDNEGAIVHESWSPPRPSRSG